jgi:hypothetical protein
MQANGAHHGMPIERVVLSTIIVDSFLWFLYILMNLPPGCKVFFCNDLQERLTVSFAAASS